MVMPYEIKTYCGTKEELPFPEPGDNIGDPWVQRRIDLSTGLDTAPRGRGCLNHTFVSSPFIFIKDVAKIIIRGVQPSDRASDSE